MRVKYLPLIAACLLMVACATTPHKETEEEVFTPNWETHAQDATIINSTPIAAKTAPIDEGISSASLELKQFATINHRVLGHELRKGQGRNLSELLKLLKIKEKDRTSSIRKIRSLYKNSSSADSFAEALWRWHKASR